MTTNIWLEKGWGDYIENATLNDISIAIGEITRMDDEHAAFWVGNLDNGFVLEAHKTLDVFFVYGENDDEQIQAKLKNWEDAIRLFKLYFDHKYNSLKAEIECRLFSS
jgi:hypothetical protein